MNVRTHRQANTDLLRLKRLKTSPLCESYAVRLQVSNVLARNCSTAGVQGAPKSFTGSIMRNVEISYPRLNTQAGETVRHTVGGVGVRCGKKRMSTCNGLDTGSKFATAMRHLRPARNGADVPRVSHYEKSERTTLREESKGRQPLGKLVHLSPKGNVAISQYRKVGVNFTPTGGPIRACLLGGLSRVMGNYHARFLGGLGLATAPGYPVLFKVYDF